MKEKNQYRYARRIIVVVFGFTLMVIGIAMIFLPGPAIVVIPLSLAVLGTEFIWAKNLLGQIKKHTDRVKDGIGRIKMKKTNIQ